MRSLPAHIVELLKAKADHFEHPGFIESDPIRVPHMFSKKQDIEIAGFLTASISWGRRQTIIKNATRLMSMMDYSPHDFILHATHKELSKFRSFTHRTFKGDDCQFFLTSLQRIYRESGSLEDLFLAPGDNIQVGIMQFRRGFLKETHFQRSEKHLPDPISGSASKRINMFLRWMVRSNARGVDFGLWTRIRPASLYCPLDVHSGNTARSLGILDHRQNDWKAVVALTDLLSTIDPEDPVKFDYALFGIGANEPNPSGTN